VARAPDELLELVLDVVVELETGRIEDLQPVVLGRVVRGGDHDPGGELPGAGEERQRRRRHDPDPVDVDTEARRAAADPRHEHVARATGVLADDDRPAGPGQPGRRRPPQVVSDGRLEIDVGDAPDAGRPEQAAHYGPLGEGVGLGGAVGGATAATVTVISAGLIPTSLTSAGSEILSLTLCDPGARPSTSATTARLRGSRASRLATVPPTVTRTESVESW